MQGISNKYIEQFMSRFKIDFKGVFASDEIPFFPGSNFSLICNLSRKNDKGSHFIAIYVLSKTIIYFDSYIAISLTSEITGAVSHTILYT